MPVDKPPVEALSELSLSSGEPFGPDNKSKATAIPSVGLTRLSAAEDPGSEAGIIFS
jgi:hypothetical protein